METTYLELEQQEDNALVVRARRGTKQWEHHLPAASWQSLEQGARQWIEQFENGYRPLQNPAVLENLGVVLKRECFEPFYDAMIESETGGQIVLWSNRDECLNLPWELLPVGANFLGTSPQWKLRRTIRKGILPESSLGPGATPLRVLFMSCAPIDQKGLDFEKEEEAILRLTTRISGSLHLHIAESGTFEELRQIISELKPHVVHLSGHGIVREGLGHFAFENDRGRTDLRNAHDIGQQLFAGSSVRLVFVNACQSSQAAASGLCQTLVRDGYAPLALGWAASIADDLATEFARQFYHELAAGRGVDAAITVARRQIQVRGRRQQGEVQAQDASFALPQLYTAHQLDTLVDKSRIDKPEIPPVRYALLGDEVRGLREGFVGRRREMQRTRPALRDGEARVLLLSGIGGAGKSTLATRLANRFQVDGYRVVALKARDEEQLGFGFRLVTEVAVACQRLGLITDEKTLRDGERDLSERLRLLVEVLNEAKILLVLDNLESLLNEQPAPTYWKDESVSAFFKVLFSHLTGEGRAILTCRYLPEGFDTEQPQLEHLALPDFAESDFFKYLRRHDVVAQRMENGELQRDLLENFYHKLGATPRFLEQACVILQKIGADDLQEQLDTIHLEDVAENDLAQLQQQYFADLFLPRLFEALSIPSRNALCRLALIEPPLPIDGVAKVTGLDEICAQFCIDAWLRLGLVQRFQERGEVSLYAVYSLQRAFFITLQNLAAEVKLATHVSAIAFFQDAYQRNREKEIGLGIQEELAACLRHATESGDVECQRWAIVRLSRYLQSHSEFQTALDLMGDLLNKTRHPELLKEYGDALERLSNWKMAREYYREALYDYGDQDAFGACLLHQLATIDINEGHYAAARIGCEKALSTHQSIGNLAGELASWHQLASINMYEGKYVAARADFEKALVMFQSMDNRKDEANVWHQLATIDMYEGHYCAARIGFEKALEIRQSIGDRTGKAHSWHQLATIDMYEGHYCAARIGFEKALEMRQAIGDRAGEATIWHNLASIDMYEGDYSAARAGFEKALGICQSIGGRTGESLSWRQLARIDMYEGNYSAARAGFEKVLEMGEAIGDPVDEAIIWHSLARIGMYERDYSAARIGFEKALELRQSIGDRAGEASTFNQIGCIAWQRQQAVGIRLAAISFGIYQAIGETCQQEVRENLFGAANELGLDQVSFDAILQDAAEAYERDRCAELVRQAFEGLD